MSLGTRGTGVVLDAQEQKMHYFYVEGVIPILHIPTDEEKAFSGTGEMLQQKIKKSYSQDREQDVADELIAQINPAVVNEVGTQQFLQDLAASRDGDHPMTIRSADYAVVQKRKNTADDIIKTIVEEGSYYVKYLCTHSDYLLQAPAQFISKGDDQYGFYRFNIRCSLNHGVVQDQTDFSNEIQTIHKELRKKSGTSPLMFIDAQNHVYSVGFSGLTDALQSTVPLLLDIVYVVVTRRSSKSRKILEVFVKFVENLDSEFSDIFTRLFDISENYRFRLGSVGLGFWTLSFTSRDGKEHYATQVYLANKFPRYFLYIDTPDVNKIWKKNEFRYDSMVKKIVIANFHCLTGLAACLLKDHQLFLTKICFYKKLCFICLVGKLAETVTAAAAAVAVKATVAAVLEATVARKRREVASLDLQMSMDFHLMWMWLQLCFNLLFQSVLHKIAQSCANGNEMILMRLHLGLP